MEALAGRHGQSLIQHRTVTPIQDAKRPEVWWGQGMTQKLLSMCLATDSLLGPSTRSFVQSEGPGKLNSPECQRRGCEGHDLGLQACMFGTSPLGWQVGAGMRGSQHQSIEWIPGRSNLEQESFRLGLACRFSC